ncbi:MAG: type II secretion system protein, partial [Rickettsiales bacterium]|nr:type II secretion system protein [Rickettsiales bacterium]
MKIAKKSKPHGFSLIEVSVVILIIGIFAASVFVADKMISKFRLKTAEALTRSSPINGITKSALWLETSLESSFASSSMNTGDAIESWNDQKNTANKVAVTAVG